MNNYQSETAELNAIKCEFEQLRKDLETVKQEKEYLQANLNQADNQIQFLKGQIEAYQYALNCHRY